jgi:hypothetical protein
VPKAPAEMRHRRLYVAPGASISTVPGLAGREPKPRAAIESSSPPKPDSRIEALASSVLQGAAPHRSSKAPLASQVRALTEMNAVAGVAPPRPLKVQQAIPVRRGTSREIICPNANCGYRGEPMTRGGASWGTGCLLMLLCFPLAILYAIFDKPKVCCPRCGIQIR